jgi:hypothetical protein
MTRRVLLLILFNTVQNCWDASIGTNLRTPAKDHKCGPFGNGIQCMPLILNVDLQTRLIRLNHRKRAKVAVFSATWGNAGVVLIMIRLVNVVAAGIVVHHAIVVGHVVENVGRANGLGESRENASSHDVLPLLPKRERRFQLLRMGQIRFSLSNDGQALGAEIQDALEIDLGTSVACRKGILVDEILWVGIVETIGHATGMLE